MVQGSCELPGAQALLASVLQGDTVPSPSLPPSLPGQWRRVASVCMVLRRACQRPHPSFCPAASVLSPNLTACPSPTLPPPPCPHQNGTG